ncbi:unnamed protein product [Lathyrus oleraceus]|uniref:HXXXD-type acyl-transferase family protein n=2 Tax=Pisum sativum TaxID=3888 RepID=A0A9D4WM48_PEA|nr:uncharacterized acetyltransferase At3g50280-like isoform X1 [Pisum sativum]KAI5404310.1 hypothetical protein KIW84_051457 [Pisum sativum]
MMTSSIVQHVSECFIKPLHPIPDSNRICHLTTWDISMSSMNYIQKGLLFKKPNSQQDFIDNLLNKLKHSLSLALFHFYPLSGRLVTQKSQDPPSYSIFVDCSNGNPGARFIYATLDITVSDILTSIDVPPVVKSLFDLNKAINHDGHTLPLLSVQVTELVDGVFIGCSMNHYIGDGTSYWNFFNTWSEIFQAQGQGHDHENVPISRQPFHNRWFPEGYGPLINLPFKHYDEFVSRFEPPKLRERFFHFTSESIAELKAKANRECKTNKISSFQSLSAHVWRSITRARHLTNDRKTSCMVAVNNRPRMKPPLPEEYFGTSVDTVTAEATAGELLENDLGLVAWKIHVAVTKHDDLEIRKSVEKWLESPVILDLNRHFDPLSSVAMISSPRFNMYGNEFGMGKAVGVLSGYANKCDGNVTAYEGYEGGGSMDLEISLSSNVMTELELDENFMNAVSVNNMLGASRGHTLNEN